MSGRQAGRKIVIIEGRKRSERLVRHGAWKAGRQRRGRSWPKLTWEGRHE